MSIFSLKNAVCDKHINSLFRYPVLININDVPDLQKISFTESTVSLGPSVPLTTVMHVLEQKIKELSAKNVCIFPSRFSHFSRMWLESNYSTRFYSNSVGSVALPFVTWLLSVVT